jgi:trigger factor
MAAIVETLVGETTRQAIADRGERAAMQPKIAMTEDEKEATEILEGRADLTFTLEYEVLPSFELGEFKGLKVERPVAAVADEEVEARISEIAESVRTYDPVDRPVQEGDRVSLSFLGKIDGVPFERGAADNADVVVGANRFIPGFEPQLVGMKAGDERVIEVTFPEAYPAEHLAGKTATFDVAVKAVAAPAEVKVDEEFARRVGLESVDSLRSTIRQQIEGELGQATRQRVKRQLLDQLDQMHQFPLPQKLVDQEFENIWRQVMHDVEHHGKSFEDEGTTEEEARSEYRAIAERRVRLGLVLSKIGEGAEVTVTDEELQRGLAAQVRQFPGQEKQVLDYYRKNPDAVQALRAPIFEEKVIDYILEFADVTEKPVTREELLADDEDDDHQHHHHHDHDHHEH